MCTHAFLDEYYKVYTQSEPFDSQGGEMALLLFFFIVPLSNSIHLVQASAESFLATVCQPIDICSTKIEKDFE